MYFVLIRCKTMLKTLLLQVIWEADFLSLAQLRLFSIFIVDCSAIILVDSVPRHSMKY